MVQLDISKLKYVIFDWDNTLAESRSSLVESVNQVLKTYGLPEWEISKEKRDCNLSFKDNFANIFGTQNATPAYEQYREIYKKIAPNKIATFPKAKETLNFFAQHNVKMLIVTNKERCLLEYELPLLYDKKMFCNIVCGHEAQKDKPHKEHALFALKDFLSPAEITPQNVWVIGDSPQDSKAALASGALPIRIGKAIWEECETKCDEVIYLEDFADFYECLKAQN